VPATSPRGSASQKRRFVGLEYISWWHYGERAVAKRRHLAMAAIVENHIRT
jgi:hypothetical protein